MRPQKEVVRAVAQKARETAVGVSEQSEIHAFISRAKNCRAASKYIAAVPNIATISPRHFIH
jgi:hypothetical protein